MITGSVPQVLNVFVQAKKKRYTEFESAIIGFPIREYDIFMKYCIGYDIKVRVHLQHLMAIAHAVN